MSDYNVVQVQDSPPAFQGPYGTAWSECFGWIKDVFIEYAKRAVRARLPMYCPGDGLDLLGVNFQIERGYNANDQQYVAFLSQAWTLWQNSGTPPGMVAAMAAIGYPDFVEFDHFQWPSNYTSEHWWQFWLLTPSPFPTPDDGQWDSGGTWGGGGTWASVASPAQVAQIQRIVNKWRGMGRQCLNVLFLYSGSLWGYPVSHTWGQSGLTWGGSVCGYVTP